MPSVSIQIADGDNDAHEKADGTGFDASATFLNAQSHTSAANQWYVGMRFPNVTIPAGSTIDACTFSWTSIGTAVDDAYFNIGCQDVANPVDFASDADVTTRIASITSAKTLWSADGLGTSEVTSPDFAPSLQEVIDLGGWSSGNAVVVLLATFADAVKAFRGGSYEDDAGAAPTLDADYTEGGGGAATGYMTTNRGYWGM